MHPELFTLPGGLTIKTYGFCMTVGFLSAVWLAMKRSERLKADPETVLNLAFLSLIFGVGGARVFFVVHYWKEQFAQRPDKLMAILDVRQGGLEFLGGVLGAVAAVLVYATIKKFSTRLYLDILAPSLMWGLAIGRVGCFFNGCCFGAPCVLPDSNNQPRYAWAVEFPYGSPPHLRQWENRQVTLPAELVTTGKQRVYANLVPASVLAMPVEKRYGPQWEMERLWKLYSKAKEADPDSQRAEDLKKAFSASRESAQKHQTKTHLNLLIAARTHPSRKVPTRMTSDSELEELAAACHTLPIHPTQLYSSINALVLSLFLSAFLYVRRRHGTVFFMMIILYPVSRFLVEMIRCDNPHDVAGMTVSQFVSIMLMVIGIIGIVALYRFCPERSPRAVAYVPPQEEENSG